MSEAEKYLKESGIKNGYVKYQVNSQARNYIELSKLLTDFSNQENKEKDEKLESALKTLHIVNKENKELRDKIKMIISDDVGHKSDEKLRWILIDKVINT